MRTKPPAPGSANPPQQPQNRTCGLIMPISALDGASAEHWAEVRDILTSAVESIQSPGFTVRLVSDADETGVIQKRIIQNVYSSDIVVCDVSGKNPNVMFELGMRLAFDKAVVIVKDDKTDYSFDTGIIEHLTYPRDLRFNRVVTFKQSLAAKVSATVTAAMRNDHSTFLKNFGSFHVASLSSTEVSPENLTLEALDDIRRELSRLSRKMNMANHRWRLSEIDSDEALTRLSEYLGRWRFKDHVADPSKFDAFRDAQEWGATDTLGVPPETLPPS